MEGGEVAGKRLLCDFSVNTIVNFDLRDLVGSCENC